MTPVLLLHGGEVPHYRVPVYNHLAHYLRARGFDLAVTSNRIQAGNVAPIEFAFIPMRLSVGSITRLLRRGRYAALIMFVDLRHRYLFPVYFAAKCGLGCALLWWGQGRDLAAPNSQLKNLAYAIEHAICNAIILYADHLRKYVLRRFHKKIFVANNTLAITYSGLPPEKRESVLQSFNIYTRKNIICMGRLQRRKRVGNLIAALRHMNRPDVGLIFAGPDCDGVLVDVTDRNIYKLGPIYGDDRFDLLSAADVYCLPGAVGLSIVDAFYCGLPFVTEDGDESAEIAYLRDGENGFVVPRGDTVALSQRLLQLIDDPVLRGEFSRAARREAESNASIERLCEGFLHALQYATRQ